MKLRNMLNFYNSLHLISPQRLPRDGPPCGPSFHTSDFDLSGITTNEDMVVFEEDQWMTMTEAAVGGGDETLDLEELIDIELVRLKDERILNISFVEKARQKTRLPEKGMFIRESISKFIEDGEAEFARLSAAIENQNTFESISNAGIGIRKAAYRIGAIGLWSSADDYVKYSKSDNRSRGELLPKYEIINKEFNEIKNDFRVNLLEHAHTAEARLVDDPPIPPTDPSVVNPYCCSSRHSSRS